VGEQVKVSNVTFAERSLQFTLRHTAAEAVIV